MLLTYMTHKTLPYSQQIKRRSVLCRRALNLIWRCFGKSLIPFPWDQPAPAFLLFLFVLALDLIIAVVHWAKKGSYMPEHLPR